MRPKTQDWTILRDRAPVAGARGTRLQGQQALASLAYATYTAERRAGEWEGRDYQAYRRAVLWTLRPGKYEEQKE